MQNLGHRLWRQQRRRQGNHQRNARLFVLLLLLLLFTISKVVQSLTPKTSASHPNHSHNNYPFLLTTKYYYHKAVLLPLHAKSYHYREWDDEGDGSERECNVDHPTETLLGVDPPEISPSKPKIVVLGATGKVGRLVVRQLLEMESMDMTVVAFVRNYDKAIRVFYDDMVVAKANKKGPKLQIVEGNLVPPQDLPGFELYETEDEKVWKDTAQSATKYFGNEITDYDNRELMPNIDESLEEALKGCTAVISCLGAVRPTNLWTDILARPFWRLLRADVSRWCKDSRHPYYVHYASTRKALEVVEQEQIRREAAAAALAGDNQSQGNKPNAVPKIRFIRVSDLCVAQKPWHFVTLITNIVQSVVIRYHEMSEQLMESSSRIETISLRPGDLVNDERVSHTGYVPFPAIIGRDDVASLAVAAAMFQTPEYDDEDDPTSSISASNGISPAFHFTLACRWAGNQLDPFPAQGVKADGAQDAPLALRRALRLIEKNERRRRARKRQEQRNLRILAVQNPSGVQRRLQPHGLCTAIPVYVMLGLFARTLLHSVAKSMPGGRTWLFPMLVRLNEWMLFGTFWVVYKPSVAVLPFLAKWKQFLSF